MARSSLPRRMAHRLLAHRDASRTGHGGSARRAGRSGGVSQGGDATTTPSLAAPKSRPRSTVTRMVAVHGGRRWMATRMTGTRAVVGDEGHSHSCCDSGGRRDHRRGSRRSLFELLLLYSGCCCIQRKNEKMWDGIAATFISFHRNVREPCRSWWNIPDRSAAFTGSRALACEFGRTHYLLLVRGHQKYHICLKGILRRCCKFPVFPIPERIPCR